jgi:transcriptional regulator GlxA family with amidase domain
MGEPGRPKVTTGMHRASTIQTRAQLAGDAIAAMEAEYATPLTVRDVARRIATSPRELQRCLSDAAEGTFREHLTRIRMQRGAELLSETSLTVRKIAARVGYRQPAQFAKAFARAFGVPPARYRRLLLPTDATPAQRPAVGSETSP